MVAGARLNRAQQRILAMRPYAIETSNVLAQVVGAANATREGQNDGSAAIDHPLLARRPEKSALMLILSSDRGLCGSFNSNINKTGERGLKERLANGQKVELAIVGRKGRDYFRRRKAPIFHVFEAVWDNPGPERAREIARVLLKPFVAGEVDSVYLVYNEFKSAVTQRVVFEPLLPITKAMEESKVVGGVDKQPDATFSFEPSESALLERLVPMYIEITILRALYESMASFYGAQMTAMDSATKNASELIDNLTLRYNRARQAAITTEIMEIIGGAEALKG
jgi:F-type H+-transporting ATPase subunit gamma